MTLNIVLEGDICGCAREAGLLNPSHEVLVLGHVAQIWHVVVGRESDGPCLREHLKPLLERLALVCLVVIVRTMGLGTLLSMLAGIKFVVLWVILLLLPPMALEALVLVRAAVLILIDELS